MELINLPVTVIDIDEDDVIDTSCLISLSHVRAYINVCDLETKVIKSARLFMPINRIYNDIRIECWSNSSLIDICGFECVDHVNFAVFDVTNCINNAEDATIPCRFLPTQTAPGLLFDITPGSADPFVEVQVEDARFLPRETITTSIALADSFTLSTMLLNSSIIAERQLFRSLLKEDISLVFNSNFGGSGYVGIFPPKWGLSCLLEWDDDEKILYDGQKKPVRFIPTINDQSVLIDAAGSRIYAKIHPSTVEITSVGETTTITLDRTTGRIISKNKNNRIITFDYRNNLIGITEYNGNRILVRRLNNQLFISLNNGDVSYLCLCSVSGILSVLEYSLGPNRGEETISYGESNRLLSIESFDGETVVAEYYTNGKVKRILKSNSEGDEFETTSFSYGRDSCSLKDEFGKVIAYRFDNSFEILSTFDASSGNMLFVGKRNSSEDDYVLISYPIPLLNPDLMSNQRDKIVVTGQLGMSSSSFCFDELKIELDEEDSLSDGDYILSFVVKGRASLPIWPGYSNRGVEIWIRVAYADAPNVFIALDNIRVESDCYDTVSQSIHIKSKHNSRGLILLRVGIVVTDEEDTFTISASVSKARKVADSFGYFIGGREGLGFLRTFEPERISASFGGDSLEIDATVSHSDALTNLFSWRNSNGVLFFNNGKSAIYGADDLDYVSENASISSTGNFMLVMNDPSGSISTTRYVLNPNHIEVISACFTLDGQHVRRSYATLDNLGRVLSRNVDSNVTIYSYDENGLIQSVVRGDNCDEREEYSYDDCDRLQSVLVDNESYNSHDTYHYYDNYERMSFSQHMGHPYEVYFLDEGYGPVNTIYRWFGSIEFQREQDGRVLSVSDGLSAAHFAYNSKKELFGAYCSGSVERVYSDSLRETSIIVNSFLCTTKRDGYGRDYEFKVNGSLKSRMIYSDKDIYTDYFDIESNDPRLWVSNSSRLIFKYEAVDDTMIHYLYDGIGRLIAVDIRGRPSVFLGCTSYVYNGFGELSSRSYSFKHTIGGRLEETYYRTQGGNLTATTSTFDRFGVQISIDDQVQYNNCGNVVGRERLCGNASISEETMFSVLETEDESHKTISTITNFDGSTIFESSLERGQDGLVVACSSTIRGQSTIFYEYDDIGRLSSAEDGSSHVRITYEYSPNGDIIQKRRTCTQDGGDLLLLDTIEYGYDENHRLVRFGNDIIVYNGNGYPTNYRGRTLTWSVTNLASFYYHGNYVEYMYFSDGRRSVKRVNGRTINYIYDHNRIVCENSVSTDGVESNMFYIYGIDGTVSCILKDASKHFLLRDQLGNVVAIVSDDGTLECSYQYDPYGNTTVYDSFGNVDLDPASIGNTNPFRYRGYYYDVETSLYYITSRYYDPEIGRFISPDSLDYLDPSTINGLNLYAYCGNDPINRIDPTGHVAISAIAIGALIGLITAYLADVFSNFNDGVEWSDFNTFEDNWLKYIGAAIGGAVGGLGSGLFSTIIASGLGNVIESSFAGNIHSFGDVLLQFSIGGVIGGIGYGISNGITSYFADKKIFGLLGNLSDNAKVNKRLANLGYKNLKIGRDGFVKIYQTLYKDYGFAALNKSISYSYDFVTGLIF